MPVTTDAPAPFAPPSAVLDIIKRYRDRGLPSPINAEVLGRAGISESLIPRTLQALQTLDLIDDKGAPTTTLEGLRRAPETEYKQRLAEWLNTAYADVLNFIDPAMADDVAVRDAFRSYNPVGQQSRMVTLFVGLYAAAGIGPEKQAQPRQSRTVQQRPRVTSSSAKSSTKNTMRGPATSYAASEVPPALAGLLSSLPPTGKGWTQEARDKFMATFGTVLDFCFPVIEHDEAEDENDGDA